jgi:hypothetical protein
LIAHKHYWQVTDDDFERASGSPTLHREPADEVAQNAARYAHVLNCIASYAEEATAGNVEELATSSHLMLQTVGDDGLEPPTSTV